MMRPLRLIILVALFLAACSAAARERTIKTSLSTLNEARTAFVVFDRAVQTAIVEAATSYEDGMATLRAYRSKREIIVDAFAFAYRAVATAATLDDARSVSEMVSAVVGVVDAFRIFKERAWPSHAPPQDPPKEGAST